LTTAQMSLLSYEGFQAERVYSTVRQLLNVPYIKDTPQDVAEEEESTQRRGIASSRLAVSTRQGKFGDRKLKPETEEAVDEQRQMKKAQQAKVNLES